MGTAPHILMVEDDPEQALLFGQVLSMSGYRVTTVATAEEAQAALAAAPFDLLLADWSLPAMKGDTLITLAKAQYPGLKTILFSNHAGVENAAEAADADAGLHKIAGIVQLRQLVNELAPLETDHA